MRRVPAVSAVSLRREQYYCHCSVGAVWSDTCCPQAAACEGAGTVAQLASAAGPLTPRPTSGGGTASTHLRQRSGDSGTLPVTGVHRVLKVGAPPTAAPASRRLPCRHAYVQRRLVPMSALQISVDLHRPYARQVFYRKYSMLLRNSFVPFACLSREQLGLLQISAESVEHALRRRI